MNCPDCTDRMRDRTVMGVTVDECESCRAVWFDRGELAPYLRRIRSIPERRVPSDEQFRLVYDSGTSLCPKCGESGFRSGAFRGVPFSACSACSGLFLRESSIKKVLDSRHLESWAPKPAVKGPSLLDAFLWSFMAGEFGLIMYFLWQLWPEERDDDNG
jgi:Zn-finger nucleic acid-binding protein